MEKKLALEDALQMHKENPESDYPRQKQLDNLAVGDGVFVRIEPEGFWIDVKKVDGDKITGTVDVRMKHTDKHGLKFGDPIDVEKKNVFGISTRNILH